MKTFTLIILLLFFSKVDLKAQDYLINLSGTGSSTTIETVTVENLTQGKSITFSGSKTLHLMGTVTANTPALEYMDYPLIVYPNPSSGDLTVQFEAKKSDLINVSIYDINGIEVNYLEQKVQNGIQSFKVSGLAYGVYTVQVLLGDQKYAKKVICKGKSVSKSSISYNGSSEAKQNNTIQKNASTEQVWQYNTGDRLKFQGTSGKYSTIVMDVPTQSKTLSFKFVECTDADGNNYPVVQIGNQLWMAENLKTTKYNDGTPILNETDNLKWTNLTTGAYCSYNNNINYKTTYGALYNWFAVGTNKLAPTNWHVASNNEWTDLIIYLGGEKEAMEKLKESGSIHWQSPKTNTTNESGFSALPGGARMYNKQFDVYGTFGNLDVQSNWWSKSYFDNTSSWYTNINQSNMYVGCAEKQNGYSARCVLGDFPTLNTTSVSNVTYGKADSGGSILNNGGLPITARGVCWSTHQNPTINDNKTTEAAEDVTFTSILSNLYFGTKYYLRAYAINDFGIGYGPELSFETPNAIVSHVMVKIDSSSVVMGTSINARAEAIDQNGKLISNIGVNWSSSNPEIATIDKNGVITTEYDGDVYVKAIYEDKKDSVKLIVKPDFNNWKTFFEPVPNAFPDLNPYFKETSGSAFLTVITRVDLNKDKKTDLVFHLWHFRGSNENLTVPIDAPVPNRLVALVSQTDGTLKDQTSQIFGNSAIDLAGGASRKVRIADLNKDGYPDWVYAMNREDARPNYGDWSNQTVAVLSNGDGTYGTKVFGEKKYHHSVEIGTCQDGSFNIILDENEEYAFQNGNFVKVSSFPDRGMGTYIVYGSSNNNLDDYLLTDLNETDYSKPPYLGLFKRNGPQSWVEESTFRWQNVRQIDYIDWTGGSSKNNVISSNGKDYIAGGFFESVALKLFPTSTPIPILHFFTSFLPGGTQGRNSINSNETQAWSKLLAMESKDGLLQEINIISDPEGPYNINFMDAKDVNKDGYDDLITYPYIDGAKPRVYLNNQSGKLMLLNQNKLPETNVNGSYNSAFVDIDGDGIDDLVFFPGNGCSCDNPCTTFLLYKGRRNLK